MENPNRKWKSWGYPPDLGNPHWWTKVTLFFHVTLGFAKIWDRTGSDGFQTDGFICSRLRLGSFLHPSRCSWHVTIHCFCLLFACRPPTRCNYLNSFQSLWTKQITVDELSCRLPFVDFGVEVASFKTGFSISTCALALRLAWSSSEPRSKASALQTLGLGLGPHGDDAPYHMISLSFPWLSWLVKWFM